MKVEKNQNPSITKCFSLAIFGNLAANSKKKGFFGKVTKKLPYLGGKKKVKSRHI
jgi:hypothetical protein